jgi:hypothetical protein
VLNVLFFVRKYAGIGVGTYAFVRSRDHPLNRPLASALVVVRSAFRSGGLRGALIRHSRYAVSGVVLVCAFVSPAAAHADFPMLGQRLDKAGELLADTNRYFDLDAGPWRIRSQTTAGSYRVSCPGGVSSCDCPDHAYRAAAAPDYFCKHIIAYHVYRRILATELNRRLLGDYISGPNATLPNSSPEV